MAETRRSPATTSATSRTRSKPRRGDGCRRRWPSAAGQVAPYWPRSRSLPKPLRVGTLLENLGRDPADGVLRRSVVSEAGERPRALMGLSPDADPVKSPVYEAVTGPYRRCPSTDAVQRAEYADLKVYMPNDPLVKVDRMSMAHCARGALAAARSPRRRARLQDSSIRQAGWPARKGAAARARPPPAAGGTVATSEAWVYRSDWRVDRRTALRDVSRRSAAVRRRGLDSTRRERSRPALRGPSKRPRGSWLRVVGGLGARTMAAERAPACSCLRVHCRMCRCGQSAHA